MDMVILSRAFDLLAWLLPHTERFPRAYRHTVSRRVADAALDFHDNLLLAQARHGPARSDSLRDADAALDRLRAYLRLAYHWHWLNDGQYQHVSRMIAELGRLLGGWLRRSHVDPS